MTNQEIFELIAKNPGIEIGEIAEHVFKTHRNKRSKFFAKLASFETSGHLVYIDQDRVYPFRNINTNQNYYEEL